MDRKGATNAVPEENNDHEENGQQQEKRVLIVDDDPTVIEGLSALLEMEDWECLGVGTAKEAYPQLEKFSPDLVLLDVMLPDASGVDVLDQIKSHFESMPVIMISGAGDVNTVVDSMQKGAETFLQKPFDHNSLMLTIGQVEKLIDTKREIAALRRTSERDSTEQFIGISDEAVKIDRLIDRVAPAPSPILLQGESGSGKGLLARLIHERSPRAKAPMVDLNCAGLSRELLESELFGHEKGAFTGASSAKQGLFEIATKGTVFLDEIGELDPSIQARLLKALEEKRFRRVGGVRDLQVDFRLIAATNRDLSEEVNEGRFRRDLYYRLNVVRIEIPPLRKRLEDLPIIAEVLIERLSKEIGLRSPKLSSRALDRLQNYSWPGNVRELRNVLERAMLVSGSNEIRVEDLLLEQQPAPASSGFGPLEEWDIRPLEEISKEYIAMAVEATDGNRRKAARLLDISPSTLYKKLED
ncbi:MAG: sigma-54 dependent transcriptional regulator [Thermoanaerobaculia bacterium]|nr:sigma-54 dependent transcriptional regulator [Thermoanaerobaculia bacterium]